MKYLIMALLGMLILFPAYSQKSNALQPQQVIELMFEAFSDGSMTKMQQAVTSDVKILEDGVVWNLDTIQFYLGKKRPADYKRVNTFDFFQTEVTEKMAFVSYHNRADIHANNKDRTVKWLESAVLVQENNLWKVKMLHSTRLK